VFQFPVPVDVYAFKKDQLILLPPSTFVPSIAFIAVPPPALEYDTETYDTLCVAPLNVRFHAEPPVKGASVKSCPDAPVNVRVFETVCVTPLWKETTLAVAAVMANRYHVFALLMVCDPPPLKVIVLVLAVNVPPFDQFPPT
jgi:hypothetical protein